MFSAGQKACDEAVNLLSDVMFTVGVGCCLRCFVREDDKQIISTGTGQSVLSVKYDSRDIVGDNVTASTTLPSLA